MYETLRESIQVLETKNKNLVKKINYNGLTLDCSKNLKLATQTRSQTVVSHDWKFPTSNQHLDNRLDVGLTSIRRLRFQTRVVQSAVSLVNVRPKK